MEHPGYFVAGTGEKTQYLVHDFNDNTIRFILHYPGRPDSAVLRLAVKSLIDRVDVLHSSFYAGAMHAYWQVNETYEEKDYFQLTEAEGNMMKTACEIATQAILPEDKTQMRCHLVVPKKTDSPQISAPGESILVVSISHLCVDGTDGKYLLAKLAEAYRMISEKGNSDSLVIKDGNRKAEQVYEQISKKDYLLLMRNPIPDIKSVFPYPTQDAGTCRLIYEMISPQIMAMAKEKASAIGATINDVLLTACYHAYAAAPGNHEKEPMSIMSMMDLRKHCVTGDSEGICNITGSLPTTLPNGLGASFAETLTWIAEQTKEQKEDPLAGMGGMPLLHGVVRTFPMGMLKMAVKHVYGSMAVGLTNLGALKTEEFALGNLKPDMAVFGGPLKKKPAMQVSVISLGGSCVLSVSGEMTTEDEEAIGRMLKKMRLEVEAFAGGIDGSE